MHEFAILLPGVNEKIVAAILERLSGGLVEFNPNCGGDPVSISFGSALVGDGVSLRDALRQADERMYMDKQEKKKKPRSNWVSIDQQ